MNKVITVDRAENYIFFLEKRIDSIERSHSYRIGKNLVDLYAKRISWTQFFSGLVKSTKKKPKKIISQVEIKRNGSAAKVESVSTNNITSAKLEIARFSHNYKIAPVYNSKKLIAGIFSKDYKSFLSQENELIEASPITIQDVVNNSSIDEFVIDLKALEGSLQWFGLGVPGELYRNRDFEGVIKILNKKKIKLLVKGQELLPEYPVLMKLISRSETCAYGDAND